MAKEHVPGKRSPDETTKVEVPKKVVASPDVLRVRNFIERHDLVQLKDYLKERGGEVSTVSSESLASAEKAVGTISRFRRSWSSEDIQKRIEDFVQKDFFFDAMKFIEANEQFILETWIEDYLDKKLYHQASLLLQSYARTNPSEKMDPKQMIIEAEIDQFLLHGVEKELGEGEVFGKVHLDVTHDRIWGAVHNGYYKEAAEMCEQIQRGKEEAIVFEALPKKPADLKAIFPNLPELIDHYSHLARIGGVDKSYIKALQGKFQDAVEDLFKNKRIVLKQKGISTPEENLLGLISDLAYVGLRLYIDKSSDDNKLYLLSASEAAKHHEYYVVDLTKLTEKDIVLDKTNFEEHAAKSKVSHEAVTSIGSPSSYTWISRGVSVLPKKAKELREAA